MDGVSLDWRRNFPGQSRTSQHIIIQFLPLHVQDTIRLHNNYMIILDPRQFIQCKPIPHTNQQLEELSLSFVSGVRMKEFRKRSIVEEIVDNLYAVMVVSNW